MQRRGARADDLAGLRLADPGGAAALLAQRVDRTARLGQAAGDPRRKTRVQLARLRGELVNEVVLLARVRLEVEQLLHGAAVGIRLDGVDKLPAIRADRPFHLPRRFGEVE